MKKKDNLLIALRKEMSMNISGSIYEEIAVSFTYNSNRIEGNGLSPEKVRSIFDTRTIMLEGSIPVSVDDIVETVNHFECIRFIIKNAESPLTKNLIRKMHETLKRGTADAEKTWFAIGDWKKLENTVGGRETCVPEDVDYEMSKLIAEYENIDIKTIDDIISFHASFESIHPFQDGNGRIGRLIMFKECLRNGIVPFIIEEPMKQFYYRGLQEWEHEKSYLRDTCLYFQDNMKNVLDSFGIDY